MSRHIASIVPSQILDVTKATTTTAAPTTTTTTTTTAATTTTTTTATTTATIDWDKLRGESQL